MVHGISKTSSLCRRHYHHRRSKAPHSASLANKSPQTLCFMVCLFTSALRLWLCSSMLCLTASPAARMRVVALTLGSLAILGTKECQLSPVLIWAVNGEKRGLQGCGGTRAKGSWGRHTACWFPFAPGRSGLAPCWRSSSCRSGRSSWLRGIVLNLSAVWVCLWGVCRCLWDCDRQLHAGMPQLYILLLPTPSHRNRYPKLITRTALKKHNVIIAQRHPCHRRTLSAQPHCFPNRVAQPERPRKTCFLG